MALLYGKFENGAPFFVDAGDDVDVDPSITLLTEDEYQKALVRWEAQQAQAASAAQAVVRAVRSKLLALGFTTAEIDLVLGVQPESGGTEHHDNGGGND